MPAVGHVIEEWLPRSATFVANLAAHQTRYSPVVLAGRTANLEEFPAPRLHDLGLGGGPLRKRALRRARSRLAGFATTYDHLLVRAARDEDCVLLHGHFGPDASRALNARARLEVPLVTTFYGYDLIAPRRDPRWGPAYERLFAEAALFCVEGPAMAATLAAIGAPADRIRIAKIGFDVEQFEFRPRGPASPLILLQAARMVPKKGFDLSIRAFAAARERLGPAELWLLGDGPLRAELEELATRCGVAGAVRFLGSTSYAEYRDAVARAHVCIQPSRVAPDGDTEGGAPTVILEMQASGIPIVATRHADIPHVVAHPEDLVDEEDVDGLRDAILRVVELPAAQWRERAEAGHAFVAAEHDVRGTAAHVERLYDEVLAST